ncbi:SRPBCC family protein [Flavobacterium sp. MK4S-17]|uniref:SRPBCC family protein n=1 Tax=Flavobacterium sp. MK4S-17 TaxID=2543737 RepID=UPI001359330E|nr:SRPBCC family protein [Flavobacterium sp. MK4S-17]
MESRNINLPKLKRNINDIERVISTLGGFYLLYDSLKYKRSVAEIAAAGFMIFRGVSGYCPASEAGEKFLNRRRAVMPKGSNINIHARMIINRRREDVYDSWRNLQNLPLFMEHLDEVTIISEEFSEWKATLPGGVGKVKWKAEVVRDEPHRYISWRSVSGSTVKNVGKVEFKDAGELGTLVHIVFSYHAPLGLAGEEVAALLNPLFEKMVRKDVLGFKRFMETGTPKKISQETVKIFT